uniref:Uncharacterized protein n=1 Tax=viral metagenome TaxID=1070528 RepID=A0A6C0CJL3_9ZZZZ
MTDFQSAFDKPTTAINNTLSTQVSSAQTWSNVPGALVKAASSSSGYVWGYNSGFDVWKCSVPCTGNWSKINIPKAGNILDMTVDDTTVYFLFSDGSKCSLVYGPASSKDGTSFVTIILSIGADKLFSTHTYLWLQDPVGAKQKLPKPVTMANMLPVADKTVMITSASSTTLYGKMIATGQLVKTDETLSTAWQPISGLSTLNNSKLIGDNDSLSALYILDPTNKAYKCVGDCSTNQQLAPFDTGNMPAMNITGDPSNKQVWLTSTSNGPNGNIFNKIEGSNYSDILNVITPLDKTRSGVIDDATKQYKQQTDVMSANNQLVNFRSSLDNWLTSILPVSLTNGTSNADAQKIQQDTQQTSAQLDQINYISPILIKLIITFCVGILAYLVFGFIGPMVNVVVIAILIVGFYVSLNNDIKLPPLLSPRLQFSWGTSS